MLLPGIGRRVEEVPLRQLAGRWGAGYEALRKLGGKGNLTAARRLDEEALGMRKRSPQRDDSAIANSFIALAEDYRQRGQWSEARKLDEEALQIRRRLYGDAAPEVWEIMTKLAEDRRGLGGAEDLAAARKLEADVSAMRRSVRKEASRIRALMRALLRRLRAARHALMRVLPWLSTEAGLRGAMSQ